MTTPITATPYGRDTSATDRINAGRVVEGGELLGEALFRRYITERGTLLYDLDYGLPIAQWQNAPFTKDIVDSIPGQLRTEGLKDPRIDSIDISIAETVTAGVIRALDITINGVGSNGDSFELAIHVDDVSVTLLHVEGT